MVDQLVFAREASAWNASRALVNAAEEVKGCSMDGLDVTSQISFSGSARNRQAGLVA